MGNKQGKASEKPQSQTFQSHLESAYESSESDLFSHTDCVQFLQESDNESSVSDLSSLSDSVQLTNNPSDYVVGIDIGTYGSGYAYQYIASPKIHCKKWNLERYKIPTCLLLKSDKTFVAFGAEARRQYYINKNENMKDYLYFENFKMIIYNRVKEDLVKDDTPVEAANGKHAPAIHVFSVIIEHMKKDFIKHLEASGALQTSKNDEISDHPNIKWVITVPAVWDEPAKRLMFKAAVKAGIPQEKLVLALEPECAAILFTDKQEVSDIENGQIERVIEPGANIMVVDIGGGTVDITVMQINDDGTMKQLYKSDGNGLGGVGINNKIIQLLNHAFGEAVIQEYCRNDPQHEKHMREDIEESKRKHCKKRHANDDFVLALPGSLSTIWEKHNNARLLHDSFRSYQIERDGGQLIVNDGKVNKMFDECIDGIMKYLNPILEDLSSQDNTLNAVIVVGGCAESDYIMTSLREKLEEKKIPVIRPEDPEMSVMKGAILYGRNEEIISSRVTTKTYGVGMTTKFDEKRNDENEKYVDENGEVWANNVFRKHVEIGQDVPVHKWIQGKEYNPDSDEQTSQRVYIFQSDKKNPNHTTEEGCSCIGHVDVEFPAGGANKDRNVMVEFFFGGTMIQVRTRTNGQTKTVIISGFEE